MLSEIRGDFHRQEEITQEDVRKLLYGSASIRRGATTWYRKDLTPHEIKIAEIITQLSATWEVYNCPDRLCAIIHSNGVTLLESWAILIGKYNGTYRVLPLFFQTAIPPILTTASIALEAQYKSLWERMYGDFLATRNDVDERLRQIRELLDARAQQIAASAERAPSSNNVSAVGADLPAGRRDALRAALLISSATEAPTVTPAESSRDRIERLADSLVHEIKDLSPEQGNTLLIEKIRLHPEEEALALVTEIVKRLPSEKAAALLSDLAIKDPVLAARIANQ